jgi:hypothetical protein
MMSIMNQNIAKACCVQNDTLYENKAYLYYEPLSGGRYGDRPYACRCLAMGAGALEGEVLIGRSIDLVP